MIKYIFILLFATMTYADDLYQFTYVRQSAQFNSLLKELRCLVCQNQNLADSNAPLAKNLRLQVYKLIKVGHSDTEIMQYLQQRYGDFILFKPPMRGMSIFLWLAPILFIILGLLIFYHINYKYV